MKHLLQKTFGLLSKFCIKKPKPSVHPENNDWDGLIKLLKSSATHDDFLSREERKAINTKRELF